MISVLMSTYKEKEKELREAIESILNQTYSDFEYIIILDNPENELHKEIINSYNDPRIHFFINEKNMGLTASLNRALTLCSGDYIARMDADDKSLPDRLEKQLKHLKSNDYDLIGGITQMIDENGNPIFSIKKVPSNPEKIGKCLKYGAVIPHPTWFGRKIVFDKLNGYRNMPMCEDYDFTLRASLRGFRISNLNETVLQYRMTQSSISRNSLFEQYLCMRYVSNEYSKGNVASIDDAKAYISKHLNDQDKKKYLKANVLFNDMLSNMEHKEIIPFFKNGVQLTFASRFYLNKIYRFGMLTLNS